MPGQGSYGPGGKWIHDRAHRIMEESPGTPKNIAYATATQQAHKVGKSPKGFRTPEGMSEAKVKFDRPRKEYQKTATLAAFFDELQKIAGSMMGEVPEEDKSKATQLFDRSRKVATFGARKPPDPNVRAVTTKIPKPSL